MPLLSQDIDHLLDGVSQRPERQRSATQLVDSENALALLALGLAKRPPAEHRGKMDSAAWDFDATDLHSIDRDEDDQFRVAVRNGTVKVFDLLDDGAEVVVRDESDDAQAYLADPNGDGFRVVTVGDTTVVVNRGKVCRRGSTKSPEASRSDTYITVEQADFSTTYTITLNGRSVAFTTTDQVDARARGRITTEFIAQELYDRLTGGVFPSSNLFTIERFGSTIRIAPRGSDRQYSVKVDDGLGGNGLHMMKGKAQSFEDLPARAKDGTIVQVVGDPRRDEDDYYVKYDATETEGSDFGIWVETVAPGVVTDFDASTMPHQLAMQGPLVEPGLEGEGLPSLVSIETTKEATEERGWTEKREPQDEVTEDDTPVYGDDAITEAAEAVQERIDDLISRHKSRLRRTIPSSLLSSPTSLDADINFSLDTSLVRTGIETRVNVSRVATDGSRTVLKSRTYAPGETFENECIEIRQETFDTGEEIEVELEYGDGRDQPIDRRAEFEAVGKKNLVPGYDPILLPAVDLKKRRFVELTYSYGETWPEGAEVRVELDSAVEFTHIVPSGGQTDAQVATAVAALIDAHASYQATSPSAGVVKLSNVAADDYPVISNTESEVPSSVFYSTELSLQADELVGHDAFNLTDGSSGSITANGPTTITCALSGGVDNVWSPGDVIEVEGTDRYFVFRPIEWDLREAGDDDSNEFPSFERRTITDVFFFRNRLGFTAGENVILSRSGDLFNFFRTSVVELLDDDRIDVQSAHSEISLFHSAFVWNGELNLWTDNAQFALGGDPALTPRTVTLDLVSRFDNDPDTPPVVGGPFVFFAHGQSGSTRVFMYSPETTNRPADARELTTEVPDLLTGEPRALAVDEGLGILAVSTKGDPGAVYVYTWHIQNQQVVHAGWNRWPLGDTTTVGKLDFLRSRLGIVAVSSDGTYLQEIDLDISVDPGSDERGQYLDRRVDTITDALSPTLSGGNTTWTLPYAPQAGIRVVRMDTYESIVPDTLSSNDVTVDGIDLSGVDVWIGYPVPFSAELTPIRLREDGRAESQGRLQLRYLEVDYHDTTDLDVKVTPKGRPSYTKSLPQADPRDGVLRVPMQSRAETTKIELANATPGGARVSSLTWEAFFHRRSRRAGGRR